MEFTYTVTEMQTSADGVTGIINTTYKDYNTACNKFFTVMAAAATSTVYSHVGMIVRSDGAVLKVEHFEHYDNQEG